MAPIPTTEKPRELPFIGRLQLSNPVLIVFVLAVVVNGIGASGGAFMYLPDSGTYVAPAYQFLRDGSLGGISLFRMPGYPVFLAAIIGIFGGSAMSALAVIQHALIAVVSVFVVKIGHELAANRWLGLVAGLFSACSIELQSYARLPMTEILYTFIMTMGFYVTLRHLKTGRFRLFVAAMTLFATATMVRPAGQYLCVFLLALPVLQALLPRWRYLSPDGGEKTWARALKFVAAGTTIIGLIVGPWLYRNYTVHSYVGLSPTIGVNLFATVIESGGLADKSSPALHAIEDSWKRYQAARVAQGQPADIDYDWHHHLRALGGYMAANNVSQRDADKILLQASLDAIRAHPAGFVKLVGHAVYISISTTGASLLWVPGVKKDQSPPSYMSRAWPPELNEGSRASLEQIAAQYVPASENPFHWRQPTILTPVYGAMMSKYLSVRGNHDLVWWLFIAGCAVGLVLMVQRRSLLWLAVFAYLGYTAVVPYLIVPAAARHRFPADPIIDLMMALVVVMTPVVIGHIWRFIGSTSRKARTQQLQHEIDARARPGDRWAPFLRFGDTIGYGATLVWPDRAGLWVRVRSVVFIVLLVYLGGLAWVSGNDGILIAFLAAFLIAAF